MPSDDLSIGPFVSAFPGSAQRSGCRSCSTWETRDQWSAQRRQDEQTAQFLRDDFDRSPPSRERSERGPGPGPDEGGWNSGIRDPLRPGEDGSFDRIEWIMNEYDLSWTDAGPPGWHDNRGHIDFGVPRYVAPWTPEVFNLCERIALPPFAGAYLHTFLCFYADYGLADWPAQGECEPPCLAVDPTSCPLPTQDEIAAALASMQLIFAEEDSPLIEAYVGSTPIPSWSASRGFIEEYVGAAVALLQNNIDLVEWVACLAYTWNPRVPQEEVGDRVYELVERIQGMFSAAHPIGIYVIDDFADQSSGGPLGAANEWALNNPEWDGEPIGPVLNMGDPLWVKARLMYFAGGCEGLCALAILAKTILHETCHIVSADIYPKLEAVINTPDDPLLTEASDEWFCFSVQNMIGVSFLWALGQRYPLLQTEPCCQKTADRWFMSSEPGFLGEPVTLAC